MRILIIGNKGFIGGHVFNYLKHLGHEVIGCDIVTDYQSLDYIQIDATNSDYHLIFKNTIFNVCINCSGAASVPLSIKFPFKDFNLNTVNVFKILNAIKEYQPNCKFLNLSSAAVYGNPEKLPVFEDAILKPLSPYGIHKMQAEQICKEFNEYYDISTCSIRIFSAYGNGLKKQLFWDMYQKFLNQDFVELFGTGNETRDFIHIEDISRAIACVLEKATFIGQEINIANGESFTIKHIAEVFRDCLNSEKAIWFNNIVKSGDPLFWEADISLLKSMGYNPSVGIEEGINKYIKWIKELQ